MQNNMSGGQNRRVGVRTPKFKTQLCHWFAHDLGKSLDLWASVSPSVKMEIKSTYLFVSVK